MGLLLRPGPRSQVGPRCAALVYADFARRHSRSRWIDVGMLPGWAAIIRFTSSVLGRGATN